MNYTIEELKRIRDVMALDLDNSFYDDEHGTERGFFEYETNKFFTFLEEIKQE